MAAKKTVKPVAVASAATTPKAEAKKTETPAEVKTEVKAETKKAEAPATEVKTEVKAAEKAEKPAAVKKETVKKETVKKAPAKKEPVKKASVKKAPAKKAEKPAAKKAEIKSEVHVQFSGKSYTQEDLVKIAKDVWTYDLNGDLADLTSIELYVKPEEQTVYYVMNKEFTGSFAV